MHNQLIKFPDIAFFVSPSPLHIAAMVILYGHMSVVDKLPLQVALEDVWMALDMLPSFRWRWSMVKALARMVRSNSGLLGYVQRI